MDLSLGTESSKKIDVNNKFLPFAVMLASIAYADISYYTAHRHTHTHLEDLANWIIFVFVRFGFMCKHWIVFVYQRCALSENKTEKEMQSFVENVYVSNEFDFRFLHSNWFRVCWPNILCVTLDNRAHGVPKCWDASVLYQWVPPFSIWIYLYPKFRYFGWKKNS